MINEDFINELASEGSKPAFQRPSVIVTKWLGAIIVYFGVITICTGLRLDIDVKLEQPLYLAQLFVMMIVGITAAVASSFLALPDSNQKSWIRFAPFFPLAFSIGILLRGIYLDDTSIFVAANHLEEYRCSLEILLAGILPGIMMFVVMQRQAPTKCCWAGGMAALSISSFSYILLRLICDTDAPLILALWHFLPVLIVILGGMIIGKIFLGKTWEG